MEPHEPVVVAFDNSPDAHRALIWAATLAEHTLAPLHIAICRGDLYTLSSWADEWSTGLADEWADLAGKALAEHGLPSAPVKVLDGRPAEALVRASAAAGLMVIGSRGHGALAGLLQGSVSQHVTRHARCPVAVIRPQADPASTRIVVGVDGSGESLSALEVAFDIAAAKGVAVHAVHTRDRVADGHTAAAPDLDAELDRREQHVLLALAEAGRRHPDLPLSTEISSAHPARALVDASHTAQLVVVGSRGRGAFAGLLLGSVSTEVTRLAQSPVLVVR